jgi:hypothetical protein
VVLDGRQVDYEATVAFKKAFARKVKKNPAWDCHCRLQLSCISVAYSLSFSRRASVRVITGCPTRALSEGFLTLWLCVIAGVSVCG